MDDLEISDGTRPIPGTVHSPHPRWSRLLYLAYGVFVGIGAAIALLRGETGPAIVAGGIAAVLVWKATQRRR